MKLLIVLFAFVCLSCSSNIFVVDEAGHPVPKATVIPLSRSFSWPAVLTDEEGSVYVHQDIPTIETIRVYKVGYETPDPVNYELPKPITVVLKRR
jgi:hypothetical protein